MGRSSEYATAYTRSETDTIGQGQSQGRSEGESESSNDDEAESWSTYFTETYGESESYSHSASTGETQTPRLRPVLGQQLSHVQYRSLDEQLFRSMAALFDQKQRQCVVRLEGMKAPASLFTPTIKPGTASPRRVRRYADQCLTKWDFAVPIDQAVQTLEAHSEAVKGEVARLWSEPVDEPATARRRL